MGDDWRSGRDKASAGPCAVAVRALAASAVVAVSFFAAGFPGNAEKPEVQRGGAASGSVGAGSLGSLTPAGLSGGFLTDARALVPFSRTMVRTVAKGGQHQLNIAAAQLRRPPNGSLLAPLEVLNPSSPFGYRFSPLTGSAGDFHLGQDYAAACGTRVYAADTGVVRAAGWHQWGGGNRVEIDHGNGLITTYNHLEAIAVRAGDSVQVGQVIARVGTTGWSTGCHLHFETILHGKHTSPLNWTLIPTRQVDELAEIAMVSYPANGPDASNPPWWAIPVAPDNSHTVLGGEEELSEAPSEDGAVPLSAPQNTDSGEAPSSGTTASPTPTPTAPESPSASGSPTGTSPAESPVVTEPPTTEIPVVTEPPTTEAPVVTEPPPVADPPIVLEPPVATEPSPTETPVVTEPSPTETPVVTEPPVVEPPVVVETPVPADTLTGTAITTAPDTSTVAVPAAP
jgi:murein DD-endopeptidase MepM/ murein hydrolase activator NlpD